MVRKTRHLKTIAQQQFVQTHSVLLLPLYLRSRCLSPTEQVHGEKQGGGVSASTAQHEHVLNP